jgi:transcriptional regulator with XRE-family HTH domain
MTPITPVRPDGAKILALIRQQHKARHGTEYGADAAFARRIGCHPQSLRNIGNGHRKPSLEFLGYIAAALRVDIREIIQGGEPPAALPDPPAEQARAA